MVPVGATVLVRCSASPGASGPTWSVVPALGRLVSQASGSATFAVSAADLTFGFGDTSVEVRATYRNDAGPGTGSVALTVLGNTWLARSDLPAIQAVASDGTPLGPPQLLAGMAGPILALTTRADGALLVAQDPGGGAPVHAYDRSGAPLAAFDAVAPSGDPLFAPSAPPRALLQMRDGSVWVTGGARPVIYQGDGRFRRLAAAAPAETIGLAQLPDGRVAVTYRWAYGLGFYDEGGQTFAAQALAAAAPPGESYGALGALAALPGGKLLVAAAHFAPAGWRGTLLRLGPDLALEGELAAAARVVRNVPRALAPAGPLLDAAPSPPEGDTAPACPRRFAADLSGTLGCLAAGTSYQGVVHLGSAPAGVPPALARRP